MRIFDAAAAIAFLNDGIRDAVAQYAQGPSGAVYWYTVGGRGRFTFRPVIIPAPGRAAADNVLANRTLAASLRYDSPERPCGGSQSSTRCAQAPESATFPQSTQACRVALPEAAAAKIHT